MKFAIIAAGDGSRLSLEGASRPKALTLLNGSIMIDRLIRIFLDNGAISVAVIVNGKNKEVETHLYDLQRKWPVDVIVKTTISSMHSFYELSPYLQDDKFCLTTVDTIFKEEEFTALIREFQQSEEDGYMAVTDYIDDESPLYVATGNGLHITGFYDVATPECRYVSGGIYCLKPTAIDVLRRCVDNRMSRMRNFQRQLVAEGWALKAYPFGKILDIDHVADINKAERFLSGKE